MAGGSGFKSTSKNNQFGKSGIFGNEVVKDQSGPVSQKIKFNGVLGIGQTIEFNKKPVENNPNKNWGQEFLSSLNHIQKEEKVIFDNREAELKHAINELREEIKKLIKTSDSLNQDIEKITVEETNEVSEYQVKFLERIKVFIINFRRNIDQAHIWCDSFNCKSKKKNSFWNKAKNKKSGGEQYLFSGEHSASRSAN